MSAMISFACECGQQLAAAPGHVGMQVQCPQCGKLLTVPQSGDPPRAKMRAKPIASAPPLKPPALPPAPAKKKPVLVEEDEDDPPPKKKAKKKANRGGQPMSGHARMYMEKANAELDEEEARHRREGRGIHFTPGIIGGTVAFVFGSIGFVLLLLIFPHLLLLIGCGVVALSGAVRAVLSYMGQGVD